MSKAPAELKWAGAITSSAREEDIVHSTEERRYEPPQAEEEYDPNDVEGAIEPDQVKCARPCGNKKGQFLPPVSS